MARRRSFFAVSAVLILLGLGSLLFQGLNLGIDFTGGTLWMLQFDDAADEQSLRAVLADHDLPGSVVQRVGDGAAVEFIVRTRPITDEVRRALSADFAEQIGSYEVLSFDEVSPTIGDEIRRNAIIALVVATLGMILYITIRFEYRFALAAIAALMHDILVVVGVFSLIQMEVDATFVAAVLTVFGYSVNDTIVIFDRVRENLNQFQRQAPADVVDLSLNQTLTRSINTTVTTLLAVGAIYLFGGVTIQDFALALLIGIGIGAYSSIAIASPVWLELRRRADRTRKSTPA